MAARSLPLVFVAGLLASAASAQDAVSLSLGTLQPGGYQVIQERLTGDAMLDIALDLKAGQVLSVDLKGPAGFLILPPDQDAAIYNADVSGPVADLPLDRDGRYHLRAFLPRPAARRGETALVSLGIAVTAPDYADGLSGGPDFWAVSGLEPGSTLNLRDGPDTRYTIIARLDPGDLLQNRGCRLTGDRRWCNVREAGTGWRGWVVGDYLAEAAPPKAPAMPAGGPEGNGFPFDATGTLPCALGGATPAPCPFGVIRDGPGNAGVWIAPLPGTERQILFEAGRAVAVSPAEDFTATRRDDTHVIDIGAERYEIPDAAINGG